VLHSDPNRLQIFQPLGAGNLNRGIIEAAALAVLVMPLAQDPL